MAFTSSYTPGLIQQSEYYYGTPEMTPGLSGSFSGSFQGDGSALTGISSTPFPFIGDAEITGSLDISGSGGLKVKGPIEVSMTASSGVIPLSIKTISDLSSDVLIQIRDDGGSFDLMTFDSEGRFNMRGTSTDAEGAGFYASNGGVVHDHVKMGFVSGKASLSISANAGDRFKVLTNGSNTSPMVGLTGRGTLALGTQVSSATLPNEARTNTMFIKTGTAPSTAEADNIQFFAQDVNSVAGTASPTFLTEDGTIIQLGVTSSLSYVSASAFKGDGSQLTNIPSIYTSDGNILSTRTINDRAGGFTGTAGSNALKMNVRNSGALLVAGYQNNGNPGTTNHLIQWGPGATDGSMNVRGKLGLTGGGGRIDLTNSGGSQYFTVAQTGITSTVSLSATTITNNSAVADTKLTGSFTGSFVGDGNNITNISPSNISYGNNIEIGGTVTNTYGVAIGKSSTSAGQAVAIGGFSNAAFGAISLGQSTVGGQYTVAIGMDAGHSSGENSVLLGYQAGKNSSGNNNIAFGYRAGFNQTSGTGNITIGSGSQGVAGESNQLRIGHGLHGALISGSLSDGGVMIRGQVSASSYIGDGSGLTNLPAASAGSTAGRVVFTTTNGELTSETGFTYDATTDRLTVPNLTTTTFTASFITSSTIETSGSNIFGDEAGVDTQTLIGTTKMTGSAQIIGPTKITGSLFLGDEAAGSGLFIATHNGYEVKYQGTSETNILSDTAIISQVKNASGHYFGVGGTDNQEFLIGQKASMLSSTNILFDVYDSTFIVGRGTTGTGINQITGSLNITGSGGLTVESSGSTVFEVIGSEGTLFSVDDDLDGTLLDVKDRSGIPVLQASASGEIYLGQSPQSLYTTAVISSTIADVTQSLYRLDTSSYGGAFFDYIAHSGSNARGGTVSSVWTPGGSVVFSETTTTHIGDTSNLNLVVHFSQSQAQLACYADTDQYNIKVITRAI